MTTTVQEMGWEKTKNGKLLDAATGKFDVLLTADRRIPYQQNMVGRTISLVVIRPKRLRMEYIKPMAARIAAAIANAAVGEVIVVN